MRTEEKLDATPNWTEMQGGLRGLTERIEREAPKRVALAAPVEAAPVAPDFRRAAAGLHAFEHGLDGLWPDD